MMRKRFDLTLCALLVLGMLMVGLAGCEGSTFMMEGGDADAAADTAMDAVQDTPPDAAADAPQDAPAEEIADPCSGVACGSHAHCSAGACVCDEGYEGDPAAGCAPVPSVEERVRQRLVAIARAELGACEGVVEKPYMLGHPTLWCYDFVAWVYAQSDYALPTPLNLPRYTVGSLPSGWRPEPGDLIKFTIQHYGMVAQVSGDGLAVTTVEGNYSSCVASRTIHDADVEYYGSLDSAF